MKITDGVRVISVGKGAYNSIYKAMGFSPVEEPVVEAQQPEPPKAVETEDEKFVRTIVEKPIGEWKAAEVKRFAKLSGIDLTGTESADEAKDIIQMFLEDQRK